MIVPVSDLLRIASEEASTTAARWAILSYLKRSFAEVRHSGTHSLRPLRYLVAHTR